MMRKLVQSFARVLEGGGRCYRRRPPPEARSKRRWMNASSASAGQQTPNVMSTMLKLLTKVPLRLAQKAQPLVVAVGGKCEGVGRKV